MAYDPSKIEPKWQKRWEAEKAFRTEAKTDKPKYYVLDMFPYPSGAGLHVGHVEGYTASDIVARYKRMRGFEVLHPMGWDAFGLPAEQYAIDTGRHPEETTRTNINTFRGQLQRIGFSYDWEREIGTCDPPFYKWTQWIFLKLLEHDLAYKTEMLVNWCPALGTVLANDEVIDGKSERGGHPVVRKPMQQWMLRITKYADRLLEGLDRVEFPESIKSMQRDRIGRSDGADASFAIHGHDSKLEIFTTRPDTMFGATFCVLAPEHPLVDKITTAEKRAAVDAYRAEAASKSDVARSGPEAGKSGVDTGAFAMNPATGNPIPIWVADYVLMNYGTGAIMCVPGHDERDHAFAKKFGLPIVEVVKGGNVQQAAYDGDGPHVNSGILDGLSNKAAIEKMIGWLEEKQLGKRQIRYRMRDWIFARQRFWGEPIPVVTDEEGKTYPLPFEELPLLLPHVEKYEPTGTGESPLARVTDWVTTKVPFTERPARRETDTMPGSAGSSWYFLRFIDPKNDRTFCDLELAKKWMPVDLYVGGAEHAVGHLIYSRFWTKFLFDLGLCPVDEPYKRLVNQGMILGEDSRKMSKRYGNVVNPNDVIDQVGADALRLYEMFMGPIEAEKPWSTTSLEGARHFLNRAWRLFFDDRTDVLLDAVQDVPPSDDIQKLLHRTIDKVTTDTEAMRFNTAISAMMVFVNEMTKQTVRPKQVLQSFCLLLAPYAPHMAEEIHERLGGTASLIRAAFPVADPKWLVDDSVEIAVQVNGKIKDRVMVPAEGDEAAVRTIVMASDKIQAAIAGKELVKFLYVKGRLVTIAVK